MHESLVEKMTTAETHISQLKLHNKLRKHCGLQIQKAGELQAKLKPIEGKIDQDIDSPS